MEKIIIKCRFWRRVLLLLITKLNFYAKKKYDQLIDQPIRGTEYYLRTINMISRSTTDVRYDTMKEIVEYVYYNIPDSPYYNCFLVCRNPETGKEHTLTLRHNKQIQSYPLIQMS